MLLRATDHHNIPRSHGGANSSTNISRPGDAHAIFHSIVGTTKSAEDGHIPPCALVRRIMLWLSTQSHIPSASAIEDIVEEVAPERWHTMYVPESLAQPAGEKRLGKISYNMARLLNREEAAVTDAMAVHGLGYHIGNQRAQFLGRVTQFFEAENPLLAIQNFLHARDPDGKYAWTHPLLPEVREKLLKALSTAEITRPSPKQKNTVLKFLKGYRLRVLQQMAAWYPNLDSIVDYHTTQMTNASSEEQPQL